MRNVLSFVFVFAAISVTAAPFVTPGMTKRNGLTDAQYEALWKIGKNPRIDQAAARDWIFRSSRYQNVTNWLDICGTSNNFAKLSYKLQGDNFELEQVNLTLKKTIGDLEKEVVEWATKSEVLSNALVVTQGQLASATAKIRDEIADLEAKIVKYEEYKTKYPLLKAVWNALINDAQNRIKILQALT